MVHITRGQELDYLSKPWLIKLDHGLPYPWLAMVANAVACCKNLPMMHKIRAITILVLQCIWAANYVYAPAEL